VLLAHGASPRPAGEGIHGQYYTAGCKPVTLSNVTGKETSEPGIARDPSWQDGRHVDSTKLTP
jgi:hypothetical protein